MIINPYSQGGRTKINYPYYLKQFKNNGFKYDKYHTERKKHSTDIVKNVIDDYDTFIAIGGDGLLHEMAQVLVHYNNKKLAIVPSGNGNMFASHHWIYNIKDAVKAIKKDENVKIDLVKITFKQNNIKKTVYSHCIFGIGYISDILRLANNYFRKIGPGLCYPMSSLFASAILKNFKSTFIVDGKKENIKNTTTTIFLNQGQVGPFNIVEESSDTDGILDYVLFKDVKKIESLLCVMDTILKTYTFDKHRRIGTAKKVEMYLEEKKELMIDGEMYGKTKEFKAEVLPKCLNILSNKNGAFQ